MNKLKAFFAILLTVITLSQSNPSQAAVGKIMGKSRVVTVGLAMTGSGVAIAIGGMAIVRASCQDLGCLAVLFPIMVGGVVSVAGLITLDGEQELQFKALDKSEAARIGVTEKERISFNEELDQANMLLTDVNSQLTEEATVEESVNLWDELKSLVSPATFSTMQKIVSQK